MDEQTYALLKRVVKAQIGIDLDLYKGQQMRRRIEAFAARRDGDDPVLWVRSLETDAREVDALRDMLTINVSEFFRDPMQFELLRTKVLPSLLEAEHTVSIWSAACSNGQEPYSLAMILDELDASSRARVLATDLDRGVLARARAGGPYTANDVRNVSAERRAKYFVDEGEQVLVAPSIRSRVTFREHNLLADPYGVNYDLIVCRNVLIYFSIEAKLDIVRRFLASLRPGGYLFIGATEALLGSDARGFTLAGGNFYQKAGGAATESLVA